MGQVYASGANDRWQCSDVEEALEDMNLIKEEYLYPERYNEEDEQAHGG